MSEPETDPNKDMPEEPIPSPAPQRPVQNPSGPKLEEPAFPEIKFLMETYNAELWEKAEPEKPVDDHGQ
jgi:hypothetical protein